MPTGRLCAVGRVEYDILFREITPPRSGGMISDIQRNTELDFIIPHCTYYCVPIIRYCDSLMHYMYVADEDVQFGFVKSYSAFAESHD